MTMHKNGDDDFVDHPSGAGERRSINSILDVELAKHVFTLSGETRAKLLAFLHLAEDPHLIRGDLRIDPAGQITLRLFGQEEQTEGSRSDRGNAAEPFQ